MKTPFYHYGPVQSTGADFTIMKGQIVTMLNRSYGYSEVATSAGLSGYVATDDLAPVPPPKPTPTPKPAPSPAHSHSHGAATPSESGQFPLGLPERTPPPPNPNLLGPDFRY